MLSRSGMDGEDHDEREAAGEPTGAGRPLGRRAFLGLVFVGATSLAWGDKALQAVQGAAKALPEGVRAAVPLGSEWRIYAVDLPYPRYDAASWRLRVDGLVARPRSFDVQALRALPVAEQTSDFHCVTGWSVPGVRWRGVRFADLLEAVGGTTRGAVALRFQSMEEPYVDTLTLSQLQAPDAMVALDMDDAPITQEHGAPARVVMPRMYGYKGVKWLERITVVDHIEDGYWEQRGYSRDAYVDA